MGETTGISWTDHTFNPWWGCTKVSPGCDHCYAETFDKRTGGSHWGKGAPRRVFGEKHWNEPLAWNRAADKEGRKHLVFCASMADVMDDEAPEGQRERLWKLIDSTPNLVWQLLTKRPHRYDRYLPDRFVHDNVWLGTTAENQEQYDIRWPILMRTRMEAITWISYEPALGPLTLTNFPTWPRWIIFGGESGANRRECKREWAENLIAEIREFQPYTAFFMKQMGGRTPVEGKAAIPPELMIQEYPTLSGSLNQRGGQEVVTVESDYPLLERKGLRLACTAIGKSFPELAPQPSDSRGGTRENSSSGRNIEKKRRDKDATRRMGPAL